MQLVLASASPRRADLLKAAGVDFAIAPVDVDERIRPNEAPDAYVRRLAAEKSSRALDALTGGGTGITVIGADTTVVVDGGILAKPVSDGEAREMIGRLSGRPHDVFTGVSVRTVTAEAADVVRTRVWFKPLRPEDIDWYVASGEGRDKAGGYAIQGLASRFVPKIEGSYTNVVGLPIAAVFELLEQLRAAGGD